MSNVVKIAILADAARARKEIASVGETSTKQVRAISRVGSALKTVGATAAVGFAAKGIKDSVTSAIGYQKQLKLTQQALSANNRVSGQSIGVLKSRAAAIESQTGALLDENDVLAGQSNLLRAGLKGQAAFDKAAQLSADLASARGTSYDAASKVIAKALARPNSATATLARQGVLLSKSQQDVITKLAATGKTAEAQAIIMDQLGKTFGGAAKAAGSDSTAQFRVLADTLEDIGRDIAVTLLPAAGQLAGFLQEHKTTVLAVAGAVAVLAGGALAVATAMKVATAAQLVWSGVTKAAAAAQWLLNVALDANPIGLVIIAVAALVAGIILLWKHSATFRRIVTGAFSAMQNAVGAAFGFVKQHWPLLLGILTGPIGLAVVTIVKHRDAIIGAFRAIPGRLKGLWNGITDGLKAQLQKVLDLYNGLANKYNSTAGRLPGAPHLPTIPKLAEGGIVTRATLAVIGESGPEAVIPLGRNGYGNTTINLNAHIVSDDPDHVYEVLARKLKRDGVGLLRTA